MSLLSKKVFLRSNLKSPFDKSLDLSNEIKNVAFGGVEFDNGNSGTAKTLELTKLNHKLTLTGNVTLTLKNPIKGATYHIRTVQDATGSRTITWPSLLSAGGTAPSLTATASATDLHRFYYNGTDYIYLGSLLNLS